MHVLIVDDSAVVRQTVSALLRGETDMSVAVAADPLIAMNKIQANRPDVILLDLEMPRMDGLTFLGKIMSEDPIPVVVCSANVGPHSETAVRALQHGAVDVVGKPNVGVRDFLNDSRVMLVDSLRAAASARMHRHRYLVPRRADTHGSTRRVADTKRVIAIGASTGGTQALKIVLSGLHADSPGTLIVQHMPEVFTSHFAKHLDADSEMEVKEAADGDRLFAGRALLAPGNRHMMLRRDHDGYFVAVADGPLVSRHRPSVDVLFRSVGDVAGPHGIGVILTGMGADGADGMVAMKVAGATTIAQDERSCVVFGMPKEAIARRSVDEVASIEKIAGSILRLSSGRS